MISPRTKGLVYLQAFLGGTITVSFFWVCLLIFVLVHPGNPLYYPVFFEKYLTYSLLAFGAILLHSSRSVYENPKWWSANLKDSHSLSLAQVAHVTAVMSLFLVATKDPAISRIFLFSWLPLLYFVLLATNRFLPTQIAATLLRNHSDRTMLLGSESIPKSFHNWIEYQKSLGTEFISICPDFTLPNLHQLESTLRDKAVTRVILTEIPEVKYNLQYIIEICERLGVRLLVLNNFEKVFRHKISIIEDAGVQFVGLRDEPLDSPFNRAIKRALDLAVAVPVAFLVLPFAIAFVWVLHRFQSAGPLFFKQARAGLQNQIFSIYKFRTMHCGNPDEARQASENDSRVFPAGRWLRKTSIDELPQFINVLRGEMSLVGPRPHLVQHNEQFARIMKNFYVRAMVKPGITGLAQVRGYRGEAKSGDDIIKRIESDIAYLETWSFGLDLVILFRTVWQMIVPPKTAL